MAGFTINGLLIKRVMGQIGKSHQAKSSAFQLSFNNISLLKLTNKVHFSSFGNKIQLKNQTEHSFLNGKTLTLVAGFTFNGQLINIEQIGKRYVVCFSVIQILKSTNKVFLIIYFANNFEYQTENFVYNTFWQFCFELCQLFTSHNLDFNAGTSFC